MFFFLSKTLGYLVRPLVIICLSFLLSWLFRNPVWKRGLRLLGVFLIFFFSNEFLANEAMNAWELPITPFAEINKNYEYGILLCGTTKPDAWSIDRVYIASAPDRINHTMQLYKMGRIKKILVAGGSGRLIDTGEREADELASLLRLMGVAASDIIIENNSRNTHESAVEVKALLVNKARAEDCLLITSASHMRRSLACFKKVGWPCQPFSADMKGHKRIATFDVLVIPKIEAVLWWQTLLKEWTGYVSYWVVGYI